MTRNTIQIAEEIGIAACMRLNAELRSKLQTLHTLRPASEYHEDMGCELWWWLPIDSPPCVGMAEDWEESDAVTRPTHFSPLPLSQLLTATDGAEVSR